MEEKMDTQEQREEQAAAIGAENIKEAVDEEIKQHAEETVAAAKAMVQQEQGETPSNEERIAQLKDELERLQTGLPNAGATIRAIKDKQQKVPGRAPNTPDVNPGNVDEIAAEEMAKYAGALGGMPGMPGLAAMGGMGMPSMAAPVGPQVPVGPQGPVGPQRPTGPQAERPPAPPHPHGPDAPRTVQLDPRTLLEVELIATKKRLADANERLATVALGDARRAKHIAEQEEAALMQKISQQLNIQPGKNLRLVDKQKGICLIEG